MAVIAGLGMLILGFVWFALSLKRNKDVHFALMILPGILTACSFAAAAAFNTNAFPTQGFMPGLTYVTEFFAFLALGITFLIQFLICFFTGAIIKLRNNKKNGGNAIFITFLILSILFLVAGLLFTYSDISYNQKIARTEAVYNGAVPDGHGLKAPSFTYTVDGVTYTMISNLNIKERMDRLTPGDKEEIWYRKSDPSQEDAPALFSILYVPCFIPSVITGIIALVSRTKRISQK
jgi:hypothetical protein